jgi:predicted RNase H-like HicB family nuclease
MDFIAYLHKDRDSDFGVSFPDFPGCVTAGKTLGEAQRLAGEALALHIAGMIEDGETVPEPSSLDALASDPVLKGAVAVLVSVEPAEKTVRMNKGLDGRHRDKDGTIEKKRGDTLVRTLRKEYGPDFAPGYRSDTKLETVREREGKSLRELLKSRKR